MTTAVQALTKEIEFHRRLARAGTVVDVGAHTGDFIFGLAGLSSIRLVAIEPLPWALSALRNRVAAANVEIEVVSQAVSDRPGTATMRLPIIAGGGPVRQWASLVKDFVALKREFPEIVGVQTSEVQVTTLDDLGLTAVTALKIDAEGSEYEVLRGARNILTTMRPILSVELEERHRLGCTYAVPAFLDALGYVCYFELEGELLPLARFDRARMQRGSPSPSCYVYSSPYISCFYFLPVDVPGLFAKLHL